MKNLKRFITAAALTGALFTSSIPSAFADEPSSELPPLDLGIGFSPFNDANGTRYANAVWFMWTNGIAKGMNETQFGVSQPIKRVDATMIVGNYGIEGLNPKPKKAPFTDLPQRAVHTVSALYESGIIQGKTKTLFGSDDTLKRGEAAIIVSRMLPSDKKVPIAFIDVGNRYKEAVQILVAHGIVKGKTDTLFGTADPITRGELAMMIHRVFESSKTPPVQDPSGSLPSLAKDIAMNLDKDSYTQLDTPQLTITNNNPLEQMFGAVFELQVMKNGAWMKVPFNKEIAFPDIMYTLQTGEKHQERISLNDTMFESPLAAGRYRVIQTIFDADGNRIKLAAPFQIHEAVKSPHGELPSAAEGVTMELKKESYNNSTDYLKLKFTNSSEVTYGYFRYQYDLEVKKNGTWYEVPFDSELQYPLDVHLLDPKGVYETNVSAFAYNKSAKFEKGDYRLVQKLAEESNEEENQFTLAAYFTITE
ncbi:S-layer homology domain-containing protein [Sporosarcina jeotgali]|uniref:S-layer homology domain-containing protein n=1 Tax=Sporosarcina jeotgali TaxID=3020056 RepID=A0ABZ0KUH8_9BACL|nr:S-layer homology domain-containing protein [Sporosarcina sp. B2O-1]WOV83126.1 S-layer homology domain-containing protein [Sporosarcina sp. B2O-1]